MKSSIFAAWVAIALCLSMTTACDASAPATPAGPAVASFAPPIGTTDAICRPKFTADGSSWVAGTAFALQSPQDSSKTLLVTAKHLFGPDGGRPTEIIWNEMPMRVSGVVCKTFGTGAIWTAEHPLAIPDSHTLNPNLPRDIAAFPLDLSKVSGRAPVVLKLAHAEPKVGDQVWLVAQLVGGAPKTELLHFARVVRVDHGILYFAYDNRDLVIQATSGGPIVNGNGEVIGVNFGGGKQKADGPVIGIATSLSSIKLALELSHL